MIIKNITENHFKNEKNEDITYYVMTIIDDAGKIWTTKKHYGAPVYQYKVSRRALDAVNTDYDKLIDKKIDNVFIDWKQHKIKKIYLKPQAQEKVSL